MWYDHTIKEHSPAFEIVELLDEWTTISKRDRIRYQMGYNSEGDFVLISQGQLYRVKTIYYEDGRIPQSNVVHVHPTRW